MAPKTHRVRFGIYLNEMDLVDVISSHFASYFLERMRSTELWCFLFECIDSYQRPKNFAIHWRHFVSLTQFDFIMTFHFIQIQPLKTCIWLWLRLKKTFSQIEHRIKTKMSCIIFQSHYAHWQPHLSRLEPYLRFFSYFFSFFFGWCCQSFWLTLSNGSTNNKWTRYLFSHFISYSFLFTLCVSFTKIRYKLRFFLHIHRKLFQWIRTFRFFHLHDFRWTNPEQKKNYNRNSYGILFYRSTLGDLVENWYLWHSKITRKIERQRQKKRESAYCWSQS